MSVGIDRRTGWGSFTTGAPVRLGTQGEAHRSGSVDELGEEDESSGPVAQYGVTCREGWRERGKDGRRGGREEKREGLRKRGKEGRREGGKERRIQDGEGGR